MAAKTVLTLGFVLQVATASAQLSPSTFGGIPLWADSALRTAGLDQRFMLTSKLNPVFALGDFDRDGLVDIAVEVKDASGFSCGIAIAHRIDRSVHIVGAGKPVGNGKSQVACGRWGVESARPQPHRHGTSDHDLLYVTEPGAHSGWLVWNGGSYVWIQAD